MSFGLSSKNDLSALKNVKLQSKRYLETEISKKIKKSENESKSKGNNKDLKTPLKGKLGKVV